MVIKKYLACGLIASPNGDAVISSSRIARPFFLTKRGTIQTCNVRVLKDQCAAAAKWASSDRLLQDVKRAALFL